MPFNVSKTKVSVYVEFELSENFKPKTWQLKTKKSVPHECHDPNRIDPFETRPALCYLPRRKKESFGPDFVLSLRAPKVSGYPGTAYVESFAERSLRTFTKTFIFALWTCKSSKCWWYMYWWEHYICNNSTNTTINDTENCDNVNDMWHWHNHW